MNRDHLRDEAGVAKRQLRFPSLDTKLTAFASLLRVVVLGCFVQAPVTGAASLSEAISRLDADVTAAREELTALRKRIAEERVAARAQLGEAERAARDTTRAIKQTRQTLQQKREELDRLLGRTQDRWREMHNALAALREARKQAGALLERGSLPGPSLDALDAKLARDESVEELPSLCREFFTTLSREVENSSQARNVHGRVLLDGRMLKGRLLCIGKITSCFLSDDGLHAGLVHREPGAEVPILVTRGLSPRHKQLIRDAIDSNGSVVPADVSDGWALARLQERKTFWERLVAGGPVMVPIGLVALLGLIVMFERFWFLMRVNINVDQFLANATEALHGRRFEEAEALCSRSRSPISRVVKSGIGHARGRGEHLEDVLEEAVLAELPVLERGLTSLAVFAAVAPLLGLLGTVSGMIETFHTITVYGTGNARLLSSGISEALITTWAGLCVAIPLLLVHAWLSRRVRKIVAHMERGALTLANALRASPSEPEGDQR